MEKSIKKQKPNNSQEEARQLLKRCFKNHCLYSQIPFEIWKEIVNRTTLRSMECVAQTCRPFKKLVAVLRTNNFLFAKRCRKQDQIKMAKKHLQECVEDGNLEAMYHLACAFWDGGWGFEQDRHSALTLFHKLEDTGLYVRPFLTHDPRSSDDELGELLLASGDPYVIGQYYRIFKSDHKTANSFYEIAALCGNEFAQLQLCNYFLSISKYVFEGSDDENFKLAKYWLFKSANQGNALAQFQYGLFMNIDEFWISKAAKQGNRIAASLIDLRRE